MSPYTDKTKVMVLTTVGAGGVTIGLLWSPVFPVIKLLWTSSFVLVSGGYGFLMLYWMYRTKTFVKL